MAVLASAAVLVLAGAVQWQAPAGCPAAAAVEGRVHELLGRVPAEHELRAAGVVSGGPPWRLELETSIGGRSQRRALQAADCRAVAEAAAVILAVSVDPIGVSRAPVGEGIVEPPAARVAEPPPTSGPAAVEPTRPLAASEAERSEAPPRSRSRPRPSLGLRVGGGAEAAAIAGGTGGARLGLALAGARAFVELAGSYWVDRFVPLREGTPPSGARVGLGTATLQAGVRLGSMRVGVPLSLGLEAGGLRTRAVGLDRGQALVLPWVAGVVGVGLQWSASRRVGLWAAVEGVLPLVRPRVRVGRTGPDGVADDVILHEPAEVGARALAGISIKISGGP